MIQDTSRGTAKSCIQSEYDDLAHSEGNFLMPGTRPAQHSDLDYDSESAMVRMNLEGLESPFTWQYNQTSSFLNHLPYPNGLVCSNTYHPKLNLLADIGYKLAPRHVYEYDVLQ